MPIHTQQQQHREDQQQDEKNEHSENSNLYGKRRHRFKNLGYSSFFSSCLNSFSGSWILKRLQTWLQSTKRVILEISRFSPRFKLVIFLPLLFYLILFQFSKFIPPEDKPRIDTQTLPKMENWLLFGHSLQHWPRNLVEEKEDKEDNGNWRTLLILMDVVAAFVYIIHFVASAIFAVGLYFYYRKKVNPSTGEPIIQPWTYVWCFGFLNFTAVITQLAWPTAPPWYVELYGNKPANYAIIGDPAGLENADDIFDLPIFSNIYGNSPIVFGSFPSLHAAWPLMITLFIPTHHGFKLIGVVYSLLVWWAAVYLNHHYVVDLLGGLVYVVFSYFLGITTMNLLRAVFREKMLSRGAYQLGYVHMVKDFELSSVSDSDEEDNGVFIGENTTTSMDVDSMAIANLSSFDNRNGNDASSLGGGGISKGNGDSKGSCSFDTSSNTNATANGSIGRTSPITRSNSFTTPSGSIMTILPRNSSFINTTAALSTTLTRNNSFTSSTSGQVILPRNLSFGSRKSDDFTEVV
jgi:membrane-associated phospholipid phosphatase